MNILHICTGFSIFFNGGITNYVRSLAETQVHMGYKVSVLGGINVSNEKPIFDYYEYSCNEIKPFTLKIKKSDKSLEFVEKIINLVKPDLVHIHMAIDIDYRFGKILKKHNIKYIVSLHDYSFLCPKILMFNRGHNCNKVTNKCKKCSTYFEKNEFWIEVLRKVNISPNRIGIRFSPEYEVMFNEYKAMLEGAETLLPVSNRVRDIYLESNIQNEYTVLHIGNISANTFLPYNRLNRLGDPTIKIVFLGSFSFVKGRNEYLRLCKNLSDEKFHFYFLGRCSNSDEKLLKENKIMYLGPYKQSDLKDILKGFDLGCVLSVWEDNGPQVVMELLNNNIPVIGTRMGGIPDFVTDGENGYLYDPYLKDDFERLVNRLSEVSIKDIEEMKERIRPTKSPKEHIEELEEVYKRFLK